MKREDESGFDLDMDEKQLLSGGSNEDLLERMREERQRAEKEIGKLMAKAGEGLYQSQVELKQAPWKVVWLKQDLMIERQERMIALLTELNSNLEELLRIMSDGSR